jgi:perosamine synthetase
MVITKDDAIAQRCAQLKNQGVADYRQYWHDVIAYNYRMTNIAAAIGLAQLEQAEKILQLKRQIAAWYSEALQGLALKVHAPVGDVYHSYWMCSILLDDPAQRDPLRKHLEQAGIETRPLFYPVHTMPMYLTQAEDFPIANSLGSRGMNLPSWPELTQQQVGTIAQKIREFLS